MSGAEVVDVVLDDLELRCRRCAGRGDRAHPVSSASSRSLSVSRSSAAASEASRPTAPIWRADALGRPWSPRPLELDGEDDADDRGSQRQHERRRRRGADPELAVELGEPGAQAVDLLLGRLRGAAGCERVVGCAAVVGLRPSPASRPFLALAVSRSRRWRVASRRAAWIAVAIRRRRAGGAPRRPRARAAGRRPQASSPAGDVVGVPAGLAEGLRGHPGAVAAAAVEDHRAVAWGAPPRAALSSFISMWRRPGDPAALDSYGRRTSMSSAPPSISPAASAGETSPVVTCSSFMSEINTSRSGVVVDGLEAPGVGEPGWYLVVEGPLQRRADRRVDHPPRDRRVGAGRRRGLRRVDVDASEELRLVAGRRPRRGSSLRASASAACRARSSRSASKLIVAVGQPQLWPYFAQRRSREPITAG